MTSLEAVCSSLASVAPLRLAEDWDNVGLLVGDRRSQIEKVMTCLTVTPGVVAEALQHEVGLIVTHHPLPFKALTRITSDSVAGDMLLQLIGGGVAIYSAHTAFDSAADGINEKWAEQLELQSVETLILVDPGSGVLGMPRTCTGRYRACWAFSGSRKPARLGSASRKARRGDQSQIRWRPGTCSQQGRSCVWQRRELYFGSSTTRV